MYFEDWLQEAKIEISSVDDNGDDGTVTSTHLYKLWRPCWEHSYRTTSQITGFMKFFHDYVAILIFVIIVP